MQKPNHLEYVPILIEELGLKGNGIQKFKYGLYKCRCLWDKSIKAVNTTHSMAKKEIDKLGWTVEKSLSTPVIHE